MKLPIVYKITTNIFSKNVSYGVVLYYFLLLLKTHNFFLHNQTCFSETEGSLNIF